MCAWGVGALLQPDIVLCYYWPCLLPGDMDAGLTLLTLNFHVFYPPRCVVSLHHPSPTPPPPSIRPALHLCGCLFLIICAIDHGRTFLAPNNYCHESNLSTVWILRGFITPPPPPLRPPSGAFGRPAVITRLLFSVDERRGDFPYKMMFHERTNGLLTLSETQKTNLIFSHEEMT